MSFKMVNWDGSNQMFRARRFHTSSQNCPNWVWGGDNSSSVLQKDKNQEVELTKVLKPPAIILIPNTFLSIGRNPNTEV